MSNLTEVSYYARKAVNYSILGLVLLIFLKISLSFLISYWRRIHPPPPPPPNVLFGKLPPLEFPKRESTGSAFIYKLETVTGDFPKMPNQAKVFFIPKPAASLLSYDLSDEKAKRMGFDGEVKRIDERNFEWQDAKYPERRLTMDIVSGKFKIEYDYIKDSSVLTGKNLPSKENAIIEAKNFLTNFDLLKDDIANGEVKTLYLKVEENNLKEVQSLLEANFIKVYFLRKKIEDFPVYYSEFNDGPISLILAGVEEERKRLIRLNYNYQLIDYENYGTYPIISPKEAFDILKSGRGDIINYQGVKNEIIIREIVLGYYDSSGFQVYLQPIYVFKGDDNFIGYVAAVKEEWIKK